MENVALEAENREQLEMSSSGRRRFFCNPVILESAIKKLKELKGRAQERALRIEEDNKTFCEVYGDERTGKLPVGLLGTYVACACPGPVQLEEVQVEERVQALFECLDKEIARFEQRKDHCGNTQTQRLRHEEQASLVPRPEVADRLIRYEAHLSREFDRALSQLERRQRTRRGQPVAPRIDVNMAAPGLKIYWSTEPQFSAMRFSKKIL